MTNVLIGIIGVMLFIGLFMAGAFFLGPKFHQAKNDSKAMSVTQMGSQIVAALTIRRGDEGESFPARRSMMTLSATKYLKQVPMNPFIDSGGWPFRALYSGDLKSPYYYADVVIVSIGHGEDAADVCRSINRQSGYGDQVPILPEDSGSDIAPVVKRPTGCFKMHSLGVEGETSPGDYVTYTRI